MKIELNGTVELVIPSDDELAALYDVVKEKMQKDEAFHLMDVIAEHTKKMEEHEGAAGEFASWNLIDKITWYVSEAYCMGFLDATKTVYESLADTLTEEGE